MITTTMTRRHDDTMPAMGTFTCLHPAEPQRGACDAPLQAIDAIVSSCHRVIVIVAGSEAW
jgi:hypothetical protein